MIQNVGPAWCCLTMPSTGRTSRPVPMDTEWESARPLDQGHLLACRSFSEPRYVDESDREGGKCQTDFIELVADALRVRDQLRGNVSTLSSQADQPACANGPRPSD